MVSSQPVGIPADDLAILHVQKVAVLPGASSPRAGGRSLAARLTPCPQPKKRQLANALFGQAEQSCAQANFIRSAASLPGYRQDVELRQLEAFVAVATELHFGRAAERLHLAAPTLSELIRRLERELGTPLFTRTTRQVAITSAGAELLTRATVILDEVAAAKAAMRRVADGEAGTVRLGITPPAAPVLAPHLIRLFAAEAPQVTVELQRMWLPDLLDAVVTGDIDVAPTCGLSARAGSRSAASTMHLATPRPPLRAQSAPPRRPQIARAD